MLKLNQTARDAELSDYELGQTTVVACQADQRFSYCLYVPPALNERGARAAAEVLVAVHGSGRGNQAMRDAFMPLADALGVIVLAPLFPCGIVDALDRDNYKYIEYEGIRFDLVLLAMLGEVSARYGVPVERVSMFGFSGGAHFAHRFLYLHPERLDAISVCAPGSPTLLDPSRDWWVGIRDLETRFGRPLDNVALRRVAVHLAVGGDDTDTHEITHRPGSPHWMPGANDSGVTRVERLTTLAASLHAGGVVAELDILPGVRHESGPIIASASAFFERRRAQAAEQSVARVSA
ncbi:MAG: hypothetical protein K2Y17_13815 [Qipengyuania sp.]|nr:hypothetical protein [Qipengyuania sp.]